MPLLKVKFMIIEAFSGHPLSHLLSLSPLLSGFSAPLQPISATDFLTIEFALDPWRDPEFSDVPEAIHFSGEVFGELGLVDDQHGFAVGVSSRG